MSEKLVPWPRENGFDGLNSSAFRSLMTLCTNWKVTLLESDILMYVDALQSLTHAMAADSVNCFDEACGPRPFLMPSMNDFFFKWRGEHGAPESALTISSKTFGLKTSRIIWKGQTAARLFLFSAYASRVSKNVSQHLQTTIKVPVSSAIMKGELGYSITLTAHRFGCAADPQIPADEIQSNSRTSVPASLTAPYALISSMCGIFGLFLAYNAKTII